MVAQFFCVGAHFEPKKAMGYSTPDSFFLAKIRAITYPLVSTYDTRRRDGLIVQCANLFHTRVQALISTH